MSGVRVRRMMICQSRRRREIRDLSEALSVSEPPPTHRKLSYVGRANNTGTGHASAARALHTGPELCQDLCIQCRSASCSGGEAVAGKTHPLRKPQTREPLAPLSSVKIE